MKMERCYQPSSSADHVSVSPSPQIKSEFNATQYFGFDSAISVDATLETLFPFPSSDFFCQFLHPYLSQNHHRLGYDSFFSDSILSPLSLYQSEATQSGEFFNGSLNTMSSFSSFPDIQPFEKTTDATMSILHLPPLSSPLSSGASRPKRPCVDPPSTDPKASETLESFVKSGFFISSSSTRSSGNTARIRRQRIGDKTRSLQKLMPWNKKMDTATFLEEAYKYIKFLQTQNEILQWMPIDSAFDGGGGGVEVGFLGMLNRQQLLRVVLNSPGVQNMLYSRGLCVFSLEQLVLLKNIAQRTATFSDSSGLC